MAHPDRRARGQIVEIQAMRVLAGGADEATDITSTNTTRDRGSMNMMRDRDTQGTQVQDIEVGE